MVLAKPRIHLTKIIQGFPGGSSGEQPACQCRRHKRCGISSWVGKIPWGREWQPTPVLSPGESHGQRSLAGYSPWGPKELDMTGNSMQVKRTLTAEALLRWWAIGSVWEGQQRSQQTQHLMELTFYKKCGIKVRNSWEATWPCRFVLNLTGLHSIKMKRIDQLTSHWGATSGLEPRHVLI